MIHSNQESVLGRFDVVLMPKHKQKNGILPEFKISDPVEGVVDKVNAALEQIKDKSYIETFKQQGVRSVLAIGLGFCGKKMALVHENVRLHRDDIEM